MARIFVTGSSAGLGLLAAQRLAAEGHAVVLHGRDPLRASEARRAVPRAAGAVDGNMQTLAGARQLADQANRLGRFDAVIHNAGIGDAHDERTADGLPAIFAVNTLAVYVLTALMECPRRLVFLSSGMHRVDAHLEDVLWKTRPWNATTAYSESKLYDTMLAFAVARRWPGVFSNAVDPGWVPTRMGGRGAPDDLDEGAATQAWLAAGDDEETQVTGHYFHHRIPVAASPQAHDEALQDRLIALCEQISGIRLPA